MPLLHAAARHGNIQRALELIQKGYPVDGRTAWEGKTPLMFAAESPYTGVNMLELLIEHGGDVNAIPIGASPYLATQPPLHLAARKGDPAKVKVLLNAGANPNWRDPHGYSALIEAGFCRLPSKIDVIRLLLEAGANPHKVTAYNETLVITCFSDFEVLHLLNEWNALDEMKWAPLMEAIAFGRVGDVREILKTKPDLNAMDRVCRTPWRLALEVGDIEKAQLLYEQEGITLTPDEEKEPLLFHAVTNNHVKIVEWLLEIGVDPAQRSKYRNRNVLMYAASCGATDCVQVLLDTGKFNINKKDSFDLPALSYARNAEIVHLLADAGADLNFVDNTGYSALKYAAESGDEAIAAALLELGADPDADRLQETPLYKGVMFDHPLIVKMLLDAGANPNIQTIPDEWTPLMGVCSEDVLDLLLDAGVTIEEHTVAYIEKTEPELANMLRNSKK